MKIKYYLRGMGIGIVETALLMGLALSGKKEKMTDEEIRQRALEMGMEDGNVVLSELSENGEDEDAETKDQEEDGNEEPLAALSDNEITDDEMTDHEDPVVDTETERQENEVQKPEDGEEDSQEANVTVNETIVITINSGDGSRVVANKLLQAGLIDDAAVFDNFLCQNGYDKKIKPGKHDILANATNEEIAAAITQKGY